MDELKQLEKIQELERQIAGLPIGYISKKTINGKVRYYHQWTENRKKHSQYLRDGEMEVLQEQIDRRKSLQAQLKELQSGMPKARQPKLDFETSVIAGRGLEAMSQGVKDWGLRDCFEQLEEYLYSKESDRVDVYKRQAAACSRVRAGIYSPVGTAHLIPLRKAGRSYTCIR